MDSSSAGAGGRPRTSRQALGPYPCCVLISDQQLSVVFDHAAPIERYAMRVIEAHSLGYGPGEHEDICDVELQRKAREVWKETLPPQFLERVADSYGRCAQMMAAALPDDSAAEEWETFGRYLRAVATAVAEDPDLWIRQSPPEDSDIGELPEVIHYEKLAELMCPDAAERLRDAAAAVSRFCRFNSSVAPDETQLACLQGLANGEKHADLARRLGYSERHLQRILADMWVQLGVDSPIDGVAFAVAQGWVTVPRDIA